MCCANAGKQLPRERKIFDALYLVDEYNHAPGNVVQDDLDIKLDQPLTVAEKRFVLPPGLQIDF